MIVRVHNPLVHLYEGFYSAFGGIVMRSKSMQAGGAPCWNKSFGLFCRLAPLSPRVVCDGRCSQLPGVVF